MLTYTLRRLLLAIPTLLLISLVIFLLVDLAPGSPASEIPLTFPPDVRAKILEALGVNEPLHVRYLLWLKQFFWIEPLYAIDHIFGTSYAGGAQRIISWQSRSPVFDIIAEPIRAFDPGKDAASVRARIDELLRLVRLDPLP